MTFTDLASELARRCTDSRTFEGDLTIAQASHALRHLREIAAERPVGVFNALKLAGHVRAVLVPRGEK